MIKRSSDTGMKQGHFDLMPQVIVFQWELTISIFVHSIMNTIPLI